MVRRVIGFVTGSGTIGGLLIFVLAFDECGETVSKTGQSIRLSKAMLINPCLSLGRAWNFTEFSKKLATRKNNSGNHDALDWLRTTKVRLSPWARHKEN